MNKEFKVQHIAGPYFRVGEGAVQLTNEEINIVIDGITNSVQTIASLREQVASQQKTIQVLTDMAARVVEWAKKDEEFANAAKKISVESPPFNSYIRWLSPTLKQIRSVADWQELPAKDGFYRVLYATKIYAVVVVDGEEYTGDYKDLSFGNDDMEDVKRKFMEQEVFLSRAMENLAMEK